MILNFCGLSRGRKLAVCAAAAIGFALVFPPPSEAVSSPERHKAQILIATDIATSKSIVVAQQNILNVPGQEAMQPEQAEIMQRNAQQEAIDAAKNAPDPPVEPAYPAYPDNVVEENTEVEINGDYSRQEELERPARRQRGIERGSGRQKDLEMPDGPGQKY